MFLYLNGTTDIFCGWGCGSGSIYERCGNKSSRCCEKDIEFIKAFCTSKGNIPADVKVLLIV